MIYIFFSGGPIDPKKSALDVIYFQPSKHDDSFSSSEAGDGLMDCSENALWLKSENRTGSGPPKPPRTFAGKILRFTNGDKPLLPTSA